MPWQVVITLQSLIGAVSVILLKKLATRENKYQYSIVFLSFIVEWLTACSLVLINGGFVVPQWDIQLIGLLFLGGLGFGVANFMYFELFSHVSASVGAIQITINRLIAIVFAVLLLGERMTVWQVIGTVFILFSVYYATYVHKHRKANRVKTKHLPRVVGVIGLMSVAYALGTVAEKSLLDQMGIYTYLVIGWAFQTLVVGVIVLVKRDKWMLPSSDVLHYAVPYILLFTVSGLLFVWSLDLSDSSSKTVSASGMKVVLSIMLAYVFLRERTNMKKIIIAAVFSVVGLTLLFL